MLVIFYRMSPFGGKFGNSFTWHLRGWAMISNDPLSGPCSISSASPPTNSSWICFLFLRFILLYSPVSPFAYKFLSVLCYGTLPLFSYWGLFSFVYNTRCQNNFYTDIYVELILMKRIHLFLRHHKTKQFN